MQKIVDWAKQVMNDNLKAASDDESRSRVLWKMRHTQDVIKAGKEIMENEKSIEWDSEVGYLICLLHDIGRFPQAHTKTYDDARSGMDHASIGVEMVKEQDFKIKDIDVILDAVYWHSRKINESTSVYAKLVRDADKTANFRHFLEMETSDLAEYKLSGNEINEDYLKRFLEGYNTIDKDFKTAAEWYLYNAAWMWDLNFEATKKIWREEKYPEMLLKKFKDLGVDSNQFRLIEEKIISF